MKRLNRILISDNFRKEAKPLLKKYRSLFIELSELEKDLLVKPDLGDSIGNDCYKIRLGIKSKGKGKSGGARVITYLHYVKVKNEDHTHIIMLSIYDKSDYSTLPDYVIKNLVKMIKLELANRH